MSLTDYRRLGARRSRSAQWEHMVAVTAEGFEVLTPWPDGLADFPAID